MIADELRRQADNFVDLVELQDLVQRELPPEGAPRRTRSLPPGVQAPQGPGNATPAEPATAGTTGPRGA
jgi:hypothetical protein